MTSIDGAVPEQGLAKGTNWWGAFVIGLAGTILVTGIAPAVVQGVGALGIILMGVMTIAGCFLCFCLAELATMWPDRTGGIPGYATESFRPLVGNTASRSAGRTIAKVARRRRVRYVVMDDPAPSGVRRVTEGAVTAIVRRRLGGGATLELVGPGARVS